MSVRTVATFCGVLALIVGVVAAAAATTQIATDPFTQATCAPSATTSHHSEVGPDSFAFGSTIVSGYFDGGACAAGFATSADNGSTWTSGLLPGITKRVGGGTYDR